MKTVAKKSSCKYAPELWRGAFFGAVFVATVASGALAIAPLFSWGVVWSAWTVLVGFGFALAGHQFLLALRDASRKSAHWGAFFSVFFMFVLSGLLMSVLYWLASLLSDNGLLIFAYLNLFALPYFLILGLFKPHMTKVERSQAVVETLFLYLCGSGLAYLCGLLIQSVIFLK